MGAALARLAPFRTARRSRIPLPTASGLLAFQGTKSWRRAQGKPMKIRYLIPAGAALVVASQIGCSTSGGASGGSTDCLQTPITPTCKALDYTKLDATVVSFKTDVFGPIIRPTCNSVACQGSKT